MRKQIITIILYSNNLFMSQLSDSVCVFFVGCPSKVKNQNTPFFLQYEYNRYHMIEDMYIYVLYILQFKNAFTANTILVFGSWYALCVSTVVRCLPVLLNNSGSFFSLLAQFLYFGHAVQHFMYSYLYYYY